jgi:hypothetical protein
MKGGKERMVNLSLERRGLGSASSALLSPFKQGYQQHICDLLLLSSFNSSRLQENQIVSIWLLGYDAKRQLQHSASWNLI